MQKCTQKDNNKKNSGIWQLFLRTMRTMGKRRFMYYGSILGMSITFAMFSVIILSLNFSFSSFFNSFIVNSPCIACNFANTLFTLSIHSINFSFTPTNVSSSFIVCISIFVLGCIFSANYSNIFYLS